MKRVPSSSHDAEFYADVDPFDIDDGELSGCTPSEAFVLGVEWALLRAKIVSRCGPFSEVVHARNAARLARLSERHHRVARTRSIDTGWVEIAISASFAN